MQLKRIFSNAYAVSLLTAGNNQFLGLIKYSSKLKVSLTPSAPSVFIQLKFLLIFLPSIFHWFTFRDFIFSSILPKDLLLTQESLGTTSQLPEETPSFPTEQNQRVHSPLLFVKQPSSSGSRFLQQVHLPLLHLQRETNLPSATSLVIFSAVYHLTACPRLLSWIWILSRCF